MLLATAAAYVSLLSGFLHQEAVYPGVPGPNQFTPSAEMLARAAPHFEDLRLVEQLSGREVPYVVLPAVAGAPSWHKGWIVHIERADPGGFTIDLGRAMEVDRIRLDGLRAPFKKELTIAARDDRQGVDARFWRGPVELDGARWPIIGGGSVSVLPNRMQGVELPLRPFISRYLRVRTFDRGEGRIFNAAIRIQVRASTPAGRSPIVVESRGRPSEPGKQRFHLRLPGDHMPIEAILLDAPNRTLPGKVTVLEYRFTGRTSVPVVLGSRMFAANPTGAGVEMRIPITRATSGEMDLVVDYVAAPMLSSFSVFAVLAPISDLYFESDGKPLYARYGNSRLSAPDYKLAVRPSAARATVSGVTVGELWNFGPGPDAYRPPMPGAKLSPARFRHVRRLPWGRSLYTMRLDLEVLAHSRAGLEDVRIVDASNRELPFIVEQRDEPLRLTIHKVASSCCGDSRQFAYRLEMPELPLPRGSRLVLTGGEPGLGCRIELKARGKTIGSHVWRPPAGFYPPPLIVALNPEDQDIDVLFDFDGAPMSFDVELHVPTFALRFFHPTGNVRVLYGNDVVKAPHYDLSRLESLIRMRLYDDAMVPIPAQ